MISQEPPVSGQAAGIEPAATSEEVARQNPADPYSWPPKIPPIPSHTPFPFISFHSLHIQKKNFKIEKNRFENREFAFCFIFEKMKYCFSNYPTLFRINR